MLEEGHQQSNDVMAANDDFFILASFDDLSDVLPNILGFLPPKDIMRSRRTNKKMMNAARITVVPPCDFCIDSLGNYNTMRVMTTEMPNLQQIEIGYLGYAGHKYNDGEDPDESLAADCFYDGDVTHDIQILSNFSKLRILKLKCGLNGRYPFLFNSFPMLQKLSIECIFIKWDLEMLAGSPLLKELTCIESEFLTGNINSLKVLKDTLELVTIWSCEDVEGNFMDLADFPHLKQLDLGGTAVTGDIRDIGENDFSSLERLSLPHGVYGGMGYKFQRISDAPDLVSAVYFLKKQRPVLEYLWYGVLPEDSRDWYDSVQADGDSPPFWIVLVQAGSRVGYRWQTMNRWKTNNPDPCEVNWLDPEPDRASSEYEKYIEEFEEIEAEVKLYRGFHQPPTQEEYTTLFEGRRER
jgi:hypothetical protein